MQKRYYSPKLHQSLISPLYHAAKAEGIPMTKLVSRWVEEKLATMPQQSSETAQEDAARYQPKEKQ